MSDREDVPIPEQELWGPGASESDDVERAGGPSSTADSGPSSPEAPPRDAPAGQEREPSETPIPDQSLWGSSADSSGEPTPAAPDRAPSGPSPGDTATEDAETPIPERSFWGASDAASDDRGLSDPAERDAPDAGTTERDPWGSTPTDAAVDESHEDVPIPEQSLWSPDGGSTDDARDADDPDRSGAMITECWVGAITIGLGWLTTDLFYGWSPIILAIGAGLVFAWVWAARHGKWGEPREIALTPPTRRYSPSKPGLVLIQLAIVACLRPTVGILKPALMMVAVVLSSFAVADRR